MNILAKLLQHKFSKLTGKSVAALLAAIGGVTSYQALQPAVEKASDYGAKAVGIYCALPLVDRQRFRDEVNERLASSTETQKATVRVTCPTD